MGAPAKAPAGVVVPDGGWGWVVVLSSFFLQFLTIGITYTFGVLLVALTDPEDGFDSGESDTAWIGSIQPCLLYFTGLVSGPLVKRFGWRSVTICGSVMSSVGFVASAFAPNIFVLYFTYGGLTGVGNGFMYVTSMVAVQHYFESKRAMATGIAVSGSGVGTLVFGYLLQYIIDEVGWRNAMFIEAMIILLGVLCGAVLRPLPRTEEGSTTDNGEAVSDHSGQATNVENYSQEKTQLSIDRTDETTSGCCSGGCPIDCSLYKKPVFVIFCISIIGFCFNLHVPYTFTPDRAITLGVEPTKAAFLVSIMGISNVCSRLIFGWLGDKGEKMRFFIGGAVLTLSGVVSCMIPLFTVYSTMVLYSILFGATTGCWASLFPVVLVDLLGIEGIEKSLGQSMATGSFVFLIASPLSGLIIDKTGSFDTPYIVVGSIGSVCGFIYFTILCFHKFRSTEYEEIPGSRDRSDSRSRYISESFS